MRERCRLALLERKLAKEEKEECGIVRKGVVSQKTWQKKERDISGLYLWGSKRLEG